MFNHAFLAQFRVPLVPKGPSRSAAFPSRYFVCDLLDGYDAVMKLSEGDTAPMSLSQAFCHVFQGVSKHSVSTWNDMKLAFRKAGPQECRTWYYKGRSKNALFSAFKENFNPRPARGERPTPCLFEHDPWLDWRPVPVSDLQVDAPCGSLSTSMRGLSSSRQVSSAPSELSECGLSRSSRQVSSAPSESLRLSGSGIDNVECSSQSSPSPQAVQVAPPSSSSTTVPNTNPQLHQVDTQVVPQYPVGPAEALSALCNIDWTDPQLFPTNISDSAVAVPTEDLGTGFFIPSDLWALPPLAVVDTHPMVPDLHQSWSEYPSHDS
ncbi:hypothetical protein K474DRAFT_1713577 [Panus rudis PR-1116 ss-1]|nr:hypothetical protein K474DRAFT_1713577 [Panus rudis PR-1116 ss-1]